MLKGLVILFLICFILFVPLGNFIFFNLYQVLYYLPVDIYKHIRYKKSNECKDYGYIKIFNGYFGSGKSLSAVDEVVKIYNRYNGLPIWSEEFECFVTQKITVISNLNLKGIPFVPFESERQLIDYQAGVGEVLIFLIDEIGTVWNNRAFKEFNPDVFNNIVQSRKRKMAIYGTLPKIVGTDINVRRFTDDVVVCNKYWRFIKHRYYKADDIENCSNIDMLVPHRLCYKFVTDKMYNQYDTFAMIEKLKKDMDDGKLMSYRELANQNDGNGDIRQAKVKRKYLKRQK